MRQEHFMAIVVSLLITLLGCNSKEKVDFSQYITGYTSGIINSNTPIQVYLSSPIDKHFQAGSILPSDILKFSPAIEGKLTLKNDHSIEFIPTEPMENGKTYKATFRLDKLCKVEKEYQTFNFQFSVVPLSILFEAGHLIVSPENNKILEYQGTLHCSDYIEPDRVEQMLTATYTNQEVELFWNHVGNRHHFRINNLEKGLEQNTLHLSFNKEVSNSKEQKITIPGLDDFSILDIKSSDSQPAVISIYMSENIDPQQDLNGLVSLRGFRLNNFKIDGNIIRAYLPTSVSETEVELNLFPGIRSDNGNTLKNEYSTTIRLQTTKPAVELIGKGVIVPGKNKVVIPFSAVGLKAIDVEIIQVLNQNMNFFLQENDYTSSHDLIRTARPVFMQTIDLQKKHPNIQLDKWNNFTIDLSQLVQLEKGNIYRIILKFKKSYTILDCANEEPDSDYGTTDWDNKSGYAYYSEYNYPTGYNWAERDNPKSVSYYNYDRFAVRNIVNTSLGIMAKLGADNRYHICITDLVSAQPVNNCQLSLYNYQNQKIDSAVTDQNGFATLQPHGKAFVVLAQKDNDRAWLKLADGNALSLSNFNVSGQHVQMGVKGFIYGERGVWRPGDDIYLSLILEDKMNVLPQGHPIVAQLTDPNGHIVQTLKSNIGKNNIHSFTFKTDVKAQTGYWNALFRVGGLTFRKTVRIETIKPNRLAIQMEFANDKIIGKGSQGSNVKVATRWLNGAQTSNQKAITEVKLYSNHTGFDNYPDYTFSDRTKYFEPATATLFEGNTDSNGNFEFNTQKIKTENAPGLLNAIFTTRVFENSGDFSISSQRILYSPYSQYVGIKLPSTEDGDNWYSTKSPLRIQGVTVSPMGVLNGNTPIQIEVYKLNWRWWWDAEDEHLSSYINREYSKSIINTTVYATNGKFSTDLNISEHGRYFIRATAPSGHTTGVIAYMGSWEDNANEETATMLRLSTDKENYKVGETIRVQIPSVAGAVAIISLENGKTVSDIRRIPLTSDKTTTFEIKATSDMCPNTYIAVSLVQPHSSRDNDRPMRMYGVVNVNIDDPALRLNPEIKIAKELQPGKKFTVEVKEKTNKAMNYTIAIVDEGLLSLTAFRTPEPFSAFYAREALGVKTWDFYDFIYGAYGARLDKAFAVGGDESLKEIQDEKTNRFKSVVLFAGPFSLKTGATGKHTFQMPEYIGEVRTMVIAASNGKYGSVAANSQVNKPLMASISLPRVLTPGDITDIPVTIFALKDHIRDVRVSMTNDDKITMIDGNTRTVRFDKKGEQVVYFKAKINKNIGTSSISVSAKADNEEAIVTENVEIRIPNPRITHIEEKEIKAGENISFDQKITGYAPTSMVEISTIPALNIEQRLAYLLEYPHGCLEQITSKAFPLLSLPTLLSLSAEQLLQAESNVRDVIRSLPNYQTSDGGLAYWQGGKHISEWATTYAVQFMISAIQSGYTIPEQFLQNAITYLKRTCNVWHRTDPWEQQDQAYRLYVLALAGQPDLAAMNRMKETQLQRPTSTWLLASAYALCQQKEIANNMIRNLSQEVAPYRETGRTYGSTTRDNALILQSMVTLDRRQDAYRMLEKISKTIGSNAWCSTQETAFALHAAALYVNKYLGQQQGVQATITTKQGKKEIRSEKTVWQLPLTLQNGQINATIHNDGQGVLFARSITTATSLDPITERVSSGLSMQANYYDSKGILISSDAIRQGEDITIEITIKNTGLTGTYQELALNYLVPSGFEIINERLTGNISMPGADNFDIRDDRFYVYFSLQQGETKTFRFRCNAAFSGEFMLPAIQCSAMYDNSIQAIVPGGKITIQ